MFPFYHPLKTSENRKFPNIFSGNKKETLVCCERVTIAIEKRKIFTKELSFCGQICWKYNINLTIILYAEIESGCRKTNSFMFMPIVKLQIFLTAEHCHCSWVFWAIREILSPQKKYFVWTAKKNSYGSENKSFPYSLKIPSNDVF